MVIPIPQTRNRGLLQSQSRGESQEGTGLRFLTARVQRCVPHRGLPVTLQQVSSQRELILGPGRLELFFQVNEFASSLVPVGLPGPLGHKQGFLLVCIRVSTPRTPQPLLLGADLSRGIWLRCKGCHRRGECYPNGFGSPSWRSPERTRADVSPRAQRASPSSSHAVRMNWCPDNRK